jgi:Arc/MetJ-type ribon-helix-helix transcriptional regulator
MSTQVAVRVDAELLERLDWLVVRCSFENRAEAIRAAIDALARREREAAIDEQIVAAYTKMPQSDDEVDRAGSRGFAGLPDEDWSEWL